MKRLSLFAFAAVLGLASCQKEDTVQPTADSAQSASADATVRGRASATAFDAANVRAFCKDKLPKPPAGRNHSYDFSAVTKSGSQFRCSCSVSW